MPHDESNLVGSKLPCYSESKVTYRKKLMENQPLRSTDVRDRNQKLILRLLFENGALSQSQVVLQTGLKAPTVFRIFAKLEEEAYIRPCKGPERGNGDDRERKGRRPAYYCVDPSAAFAVGVDFSTAGASVIVVNFVNDVIYHHSQDFRIGIQRDGALSRIASLIRTALDECEITPNRLLGIGIGAPGIVNTESGVVVEYSRIEGLTGYSVKDHFERLLDAPVFVHNNASVIAASEYRYGAAMDYDSVLAVLVRGGVGGAFVNHGQTFLNGSTTALELGRTSVCLTDPMRVRSDPQTLENLTAEQPLLEQLRHSAAVASWSEAQEKLSEDEIGRILAEPAAVLTTAVRNLYHILHPDAILLISRYEKLARVLTAAIDVAVPEATAIAVSYDSVKACHGAADLVFERFFSDRTFSTDSLPR